MRFNAIDALSTVCLKKIVVKFQLTRFQVLKHMHNEQKLSFQNKVFGNYREFVVK